MNRKKERVLSSGYTSTAGLACLSQGLPHTHTSYLVDTGAALSLLPHKSPLLSSRSSTVNANGEAIPSWQFVSKQFGTIHFVHNLLQGNVSQPILGVDF